MARERQGSPEGRKITATHLRVAREIVESHGLTFALAAAAGKPGDLAEAKLYLVEAIANALSVEMRRGAELQRRAAEGNDLMDALARDFGRN